MKYRDLQSGQIDFSVTKDAYVLDDPMILKGLRELRPRDVLIGASGHDGSTVGKKLAIVDQLPDGEQVFFVGELFRIRPKNTEVDPRWFLYYFSSIDGYKALQKAVTGGHLTNGRARQIAIPMAPLKEQRVIATLLDTLRQHERASSAHLAASRYAMGRFCQAVLAAACSGRLTADWREERAALESGSELVADVTGTRRSVLGGRSKPVAPVGSAQLDFPDSWRVASLDSLSLRITSVHATGRPTTVVVLAHSSWRRMFAGV